MSPGRLCHKIGRLQLCKLLTLTQAIPTYVFFFLFSMFASFSLLHLVLVHGCYRSFFLASLSNQNLHHAPVCLLKSYHYTFVFDPSQAAYIVYVPQNPPKFLYQKFIFQLQASDTVSPTVAQTSAIILAIPPNSLLDTVTPICLLVRCQNCCCLSICVLTAVSSATTTSTAMPVTPYFMARVPMSLENSFGL